MANIGINKEDVFLAAEQLLVATGKEPTIQAVREKLGNTGSLTTISKYLKEWQLLKRTQPLAIAPPEAFSTAMQSIWNLAYREAEKSFQAQRDALSFEQKKWEDEKKVFMDEIEKLEIEKHSKENRLKELKQIVERDQKVRDSLQEGSTKSAEVTAKLRGELEAMKDRLDSEVKRGNRLEKELMEIARSRRKINTRS